MTALNRQEEMEFQLLATVNICIIIMTMVSIMGIIMLIIDFTMARLRPMARCQHIMEQQRHLNGRIETLHTSILQAITMLCSLQINQWDSNPKHGGQSITTNTTTAHNLLNDEKSICDDKPKVRSNTQG